MEKQQKRMMVLAMMTVFVAASLFLPGLVSAGDLEPSAAPGPTMHTLEEIYNLVLDTNSKVSGQPSVSAPVEKTGQTTSYETGDDGDLQKGITWPNPRFTDNEGYTVTDNLTGLIWLKNANCIQTNYSDFDNDDTAGDGKVTWQHALDFIAGINAGTYTDCGGGYNDWRLPNVKELQSLIHYGFHNPAVPNTAGTGKWTADDPFTGVQSAYYWSGSTYAGMPSGAWYVSMGGGYANGMDKSSSFHYVWPVRGGN